MIIVCDLDGTLFDIQHRVHLAQEKKWDEFHSQMKLDRLNKDVANFIEWSSWRGMYVILSTGRNERYRFLTTEILNDYKVPWDSLLMRDDGDWRSDTIIKPEKVMAFLERNVMGSPKKPNEIVMTILEDRDKMVECWRGLGFNCWQVRGSDY